ncbi:MAG: hypothetical protein M3405_15925 [Acidobacteriota bacterium]|jgi:tetratricopeptide (TPR) repeat protein|nr:hypothetical protein [Acidobacteriota bacterium]
MADHIISIGNAKENLLSCALFLTENINSVEARTAAMDEVVSHIVGQGDVDLAAELADSLNDPFARNRLLTKIISKCVELDDEEYAFQLVDAIDEYGIQSRAKEVIALQMAKKGEFENALKIAENLEYSSDAFAGIATYQTQNGFENEALETLEKIDFHGSKVKALIAIAVYYREQDQTEKTIEFLEKAESDAGEIEFRQEKISYLLEIAIQYIRSEHKEKAIETLTDTREIIEKMDGIEKDSLFVNVAVGYLKAGNLELADRTLDLVLDKTQISNCLLAYSQDFADSGDVEEAFSSIEESYAILKSQSETEIRDTNERYRLFAMIAAQFAKLGKFERAIETAEENIDTQQKNLALSQIAQIAVMQENDKYARQALQAIYEESSKLNALVALSDVKTNLNKKDEALEFLNEASYLVDTVEQFIVRTEVENDLAARFYQFGETEKARELASKSLRTIEEIKGDENRSAALAKLSDIYNKFDFTVTAEDKSILDDLVKTSEFS